MISDSLIPLPRPTRPRTFTGLMGLYESNYLRLSWLLSDLRSIPGTQVSAPTGDLPLYLNVLDLGPYTTTLHLTYRFDEDGQLVDDPDLTVRIYHDARMAETLFCTEHHRHRVLEPFRTVPGKALRQRWERNMMLNKWLEYCVDAGHRFAPAATMRVCV